MLYSERDWYKEKVVLFAYEALAIMSIKVFLNMPMPILSFQHDLKLETSLLFLSLVSMAQGRRAQVLIYVV